MSDAHAEHTDAQYIKVWAWLVALLVLSIIGTEIGIFTGLKWITLMAAFGIAVVKAYMVVKEFMHLTLEPKFVSYMVATVVVFMFLFYAGTAPDVMQEEGSNWVKPQWQAASAAYEEAVASGHAGGAAHH